MRREKRIYIINQYYPPFMAATGQLLQELAEYLEANGWYVHMVTGKNGKKDLPDKEVFRNQTTHRLSNTADRSNSMVKKLFSYLTFLWSLNWFLLFKIESGSKVMVLSTPPMLCVLPLLYKSFKRLTVIYNIQDLYPEVLVANKPRLENKFWVKMLYRINQQILDTVDYISLIGNSMLEKVNERYKVKSEKITIIENWALKDLNLYDTTCKRKNEQVLKILYTGNLGRAHEIETIFATMKALKKCNSVKFEFVGGGFNHNILKGMVSKHQLKNVSFQPYVPKENLPNIISDADICLVIGRKEMSGYILPSKFYGYVSMGKPVIYITGAQDDIAVHIQKGGFGYVANTGDVGSLVSIMNNISSEPEKICELEQKAQQYYKDHMDRKISLEAYNKFFLSIYDKRRQRTFENTIKEEAKQCIS